MSVQPTDWQGENYIKVFSEGAAPVKIKLPDNGTLLAQPPTDAEYKQVNMDKCPEGIQKALKADYNGYVVAIYPVDPSKGVSPSIVIERVISAIVSAQLSADKEISIIISGAKADTWRDYIHGKLAKSLPEHIKLLFTTFIPPAAYDRLMTKASVAICEGQNTMSLVESTGTVHVHCSQAPKGFDDPSTTKDKMLYLDASKCLESMEQVDQTKLIEFFQKALGEDRKELLGYFQERQSRLLKRPQSIHQALTELVKKGIPTVEVNFKYFINNLGKYILHPKSNIENRLKYIWDKQQDKIPEVIAALSKIDKQALERFYQEKQIREDIKTAIQKGVAELEQVNKPSETPSPP